MTKVSKALATFALIVFLVACSGVITIASPPETTSRTLTGPVPTGSWKCLPDIAYENIGKSNMVAHVEPCWILGRAWLEFRANGEGWTMDAYGPDNRRAPSGSFRIQGSANKYHRVHEFRWAYRDDGDTGSLHMQSLQNDYWTVLEVGPNVLQLTRPKNGIFLLFRVGSPEYLRIGEFIGCVTGNFNKALFKLDDCGDPPETGGGAVARGQTGW